MTRSDVRLCLWPLVMSCALLAPASGCSAGGSRAMTGAIAIDGSSTVQPLTAAVADEFRKKAPGVTVDVKLSGTSAGFDRFCRGETDLQDASRPIEPREVDACSKANIGFIELPVAHDGLTVIVHPSNEFVKDITIAELKRMWEPAAQGTVVRWSHVRQEWPDRPMVLFGPGSRNGTFDFFTQAIVGTERSSRTDYTASPDHEAVVRGVSATPDGIGYVAYGHYQSNKATVRAVPVDDLDQEIGPGPIMPSADTVRRGLYRPLSRPVFIYVNSERLARPEVAAFVDFYTRNSAQLAERTGGIPLNPRLYASIQRRVDQRVVGTLFTTSGAMQRTLDELLNP